MVDLVNIRRKRFERDTAVGIAEILAQVRQALLELRFMVLNGQITEAEFDTKVAVIKESLTTIKLK